jgi:hypothetical protein
MRYDASSPLTKMASMAVTAEGIQATERDAGGHGAPRAEPGQGVEGFA